MDGKMGLINSSRGYTLINNNDNKRILGLVRTKQ